MDPSMASHRIEVHHLFVSRGKVLLVEPDSRDRRFYSEILQQRGFEVCACASYQEGVDCLDRNPVDLVVVNEGSSAFEGRILLEHAMMIDRHLPVVVLTRSVNMNCYLEAMQLGAVDYLEKPLASEEIAHFVTTHVRARAVAA